MNNQHPPSIASSLPADKHDMIDLTRLNGHRLLLNCDLIKFAEASPDTTLSLVTGEKIIVRESCDELIELIASYRAFVLRSTWPDALTALTVLATSPPLPCERASPERRQSSID